MTDNELIAEFMGVRVFEKRPRHNIGAPEADMRYYLKDKMKYDTSWDWLMPVVEKIESDAIHPKFSFSVNIGRTTCDIVCVLRPTGIDPPADIVFYEHDDDTKIGRVYKAVVEFIKWYNQQTTEK